MEIAPLIVTSLKAQSNGISDTRGGGEIIEELLPELAGLRDIPADVDIVEGGAYRAPRFVKKKILWGWGPEVRKREYVDEKTLVFRIRYGSPRELEQSYQDLLRMEEVSGLKFIHNHLACYLDSHRFPGPWDLHIGRASGQRYEQENLAVAILEAPPLNDEQRAYLAGRYHHVYEPVEEHGRYSFRTPLYTIGQYETLPPLLGIERSWSFAFGEEVIQEFYEDAIRAVEEIGIAYPETSAVADQRYRINLRNGQVTRIYRNSGSEYPNCPRLELRIAKYQPHDEQSIYFQLGYSSDEDTQAFFNR